jgi:M6 family metalloprotease-like protein
MIKYFSIAKGLGGALFRTELMSLKCIALILIFSVSVNAAPLSFKPVTEILPDGTSLNLFISGDEFFNYIHDENGYPVGEGNDGFYYYMIQEGDNFTLSGYRPGFSDPATIQGLKSVTIPGYVALKREAFRKQMDEISDARGIRPDSKASGQFNNLVIYIRFKDEGDFNVSRAGFDKMLNSTTEASMRNYFREVSYNKLDVISYHFPGGTTTGIYYTDTHSRNYYRLYNFSRNPEGYMTETEKTQREHNLLANAVNSLSSFYSLPPGIDFDQNDDKILDNISFVLKGEPEGWNDLLWPHRWILYTKTVRIEGLQVYGYNFQFEDVDVTTISHEMFHSFGAPDLYHYNNDDDPVGPWDIMSYGMGHPGAWMKYKYGGWINTIPEIRSSGTYVLKPLDQEKSNSYRIRSPYRDDQFFLVEFRKKGGFYESYLPSSGMIVQRINNSYTGNSTGPPDEIYIFRHNGGITEQGNIYSAALSDLSGRSSFTDISNPKAFFQDGSATGIDISNIILMGDSLSFTVNIDTPVELILEPVGDYGISGSWKSLSPNNFLVAVSTTGETITPSSLKSYSPGDSIGRNGLVVQNGPAKSVVLTNLQSDELFYLTVWAKRGTDLNIYSNPVRSSCRTGIHIIRDLPYNEEFDDINLDLPRGWKTSKGDEGWAVDPFSPVSPPNAILLFSPVAATENWLYTPGFFLSGNAKYMITFQYRNSQSNTKGSLSLQGGRNRHDGGLGQFALFSAADFSFKNYTTSKSVFSPSVSSTYYFGFKILSSGPGMLIDGFRIEKVPPETTDHSRPEEFYPNPTTGRIFVPVEGETKINLFRSDGLKIYETLIESSQEIDLSPIGPGTFIIRFTEGRRSVTGKVVIMHK